MPDGRRAFSGATPVEIALKQLKERPVPPRKFLPATPSQLEAVVLRCLEKDPARRFASALELQRALVPAGVQRPPVSRSRKVAVMGVIGLLGVLAAYKMIHRTESLPAAVPAAEEASANQPNQQQVPEELVKLFEAAQRGDAAAQERVGRLYLDGPERQRDERKAFFWTRRAALSGDGNAQYTLAQMYESGRGAPNNRVGAIVWYKIALDSGNESARAPFERLKSELSGDEIIEAEQQFAKLHRRPSR